MASTKRGSKTELDPPTQGKPAPKRNPPRFGALCVFATNAQNRYRYQKNTRHDRARRVQTDRPTSPQPPSTSRKTFLSSNLLLNLARPATRQNWRASLGLAKSVVVACSRCASLIWSRVATWRKCASRYFCQTSQRKTGIARTRAHFAPSTTRRTTTPNTSTRNTHRKKQGSTDL